MNKSDLVSPIRVTDVYRFLSSVLQGVLNCTTCTLVQYQSASRIRLQWKFIVLSQSKLPRYGSLNISAVSKSEKIQLYEVSSTYRAQRAWRSEPDEDQRTLAVITEFHCVQYSSCEEQKAHMCTLKS